MRKIASLTLIALGLLVFLWPMFTIRGAHEMRGVPASFLAVGLIVIGAYNFATNALSRAAGFGALLILFSLFAFAISFNMLPIHWGFVRTHWGFVPTAPAWDFNRFGALFASILVVAGVACLFVRDERPTSPRAH